MPACSAVSHFPTSVPVNGDLRFSGQAVELAGRWRLLRGQPAAAPTNPAPNLGCLPVPESTVSLKKQPWSFIQEPGLHSQPLVIGRTLKWKMWEITLKLCAHEHSRLHVPKATMPAPLKLNSQKVGAEAHRHNWGALARVCACIVPTEPSTRTMVQAHFFPFSSFPHKVKDVFALKVKMFTVHKIKKRRKTLG